MEHSALFGDSSIEKPLFCPSKYPFNTGIKHAAPPEISPPTAADFGVSVLVSAVSAGSHSPLEPTETDETRATRFHPQDFSNWFWWRGGFSLIERSISIGDITNDLKHGIGVLTSVSSVQ